MGPDRNIHVPVSDHFDWLAIPDRILRIEINRPDQGHLKWQIQRSVLRLQNSRDDKEQLGEIILAQGFAGGLEKRAILT